jgi:ribosomal protein L14E/L6E/L27E
MKRDHAIPATSPHAKMLLDRKAHLSVVPTQAVNYNHLMPTRYALELESLKGSVTDETLREDSQKLDAKKNIKKVGLYCDNF